MTTTILEGALQSTLRMSVIDTSRTTCSSRNVRYSWNLSAAPHLGERPESAHLVIAGCSGEGLLTTPKPDGVRGRVAHF